MYKTAIKNFEYFLHKIVYGCLLNFTLQQKHKTIVKKITIIIIKILLLLLCGTKFRRQIQNKYLLQLPIVIVIVVIIYTVMHHRRLLKYLWQWRFIYRTSVYQHSKSLWRERSHHGFRAPLKQHFWGLLVWEKLAYYR